MRVLIGCDVDPILPAPLSSPPRDDVWQCLHQIGDLVAAAAGALPPITWLIRADESIRFCTGAFDSGYVTRKLLWQSLVAQGHELGWHFHVMSWDATRGQFGFDPDPPWLSEAHGALGRHFDVRVTRTGWDYGSTRLVRRLGALGIVVDFSALPGQVAWQRVGDDKLIVDWSRCPETPYHPSEDDYQKPGTLRLLEVPITPFVNSPLGMLARLLWRAKNGRPSIGGLKHKTRTLTQPWPRLPAQGGSVWAFYFHPEDLTREGVRQALLNIERLRELPGVEFIRGSELVSSFSIL